MITTSPEDPTDGPEHVPPGLTPDVIEAPGVAPASLPPQPNSSFRDITEVTGGTGTADELPDPA